MEKQPKKKKTVLTLAPEIDEIFERLAELKGVKPNAIKKMALTEYARNNKIENKFSKISNGVKAI
ncbi:hypothetical protein [Bacillus subtilis]|uniref:hypothetical protein n=1 Tax=Bacillus subtilis TaxID=1423 RepID=UPI00145A86CF|nr:hypothetical protein [Bacillus subtilis]QNK37966.1 hypothetical protein H8S71_06375 [Bacillus subtilis subsp. subtilis]